MFPAWGGEGYFWVVAEADAFFGATEEVSIDLVVFVFVVENGDGVGALREVRDGKGDGATIRGQAAVARGFSLVVRPAVI